MDVGYKKDLHHNYLVIPKPEDCKEENYCVYMLQANHIEGIIRPEPRTIDNRVLYYYDITAKQSLDTIYVKNSINYEQLKGLFIKLADLIEKAYEYLLNENDLILEPNHIYIELTSYEANVCYLPGYNKEISKQMAALIEYFMNKVEYNDKDAVLFIYNLYAVCRDDGFSFNNLLLTIRENKKDGAKTPENSDKLSVRYGRSLDKEATEGTLRRINGIDKRKETRKEIKEEAKEVTKEETENEAREELKDKYISRKQIPVMMEKVSLESEIYYYPIRTYIYSGACILGAIMLLAIGINMKIVYTSIGNRIDYGKLMALLFILIIVMGYLMKNIWNKNNRLTKIISRPEYVDPREEYRPRLHDEIESNTTKNTATNTITNINTDEKTIGYENMLHKGKLKDFNRTEDRSNNTVLLNAIVPPCGCCLEPDDKEKQEMIQIMDYPFVIGKEKGNVDYCLDKDIVSRYHIKITKEEGSYYITDLNSTNGTTLNDKLLLCYQRYELNKGDRVSIAGIGYMFQL